MMVMVIYVCILYMIECLHMATVTPTNKDRLTDIIHRAISWAQDRGISHKDIASILISELGDLDIDIWEFVDHDSAAEIIREQMADLLSI